MYLYIPQIINIYLASYILAWEPGVAHDTHSYSRRLPALGRKAKNILTILLSFSNQNLRQIGPGVHDVWSDIQPYRQTEITTLYNKIKRSQPFVKPRRGCGLREFNINGFSAVHNWSIEMLANILDLFKWAIFDRAPLLNKIGTERGALRPYRCENKLLFSQKN